MLVCPVRIQQICHIAVLGMVVWLVPTAFGAIFQSDLTEAVSIGGFP